MLASQNDRASCRVRALARPGRNRLNRALNTITTAQLDVDPARHAGFAVAREHLHELRAHDVVDTNILGRFRQTQHIAQPAIGISDRAIRARSEEAHRRVFDIKRFQVGRAGRFALAGDRTNTPEHFVTR